MRRREKAIALREAGAPRITNCWLADRIVNMTANAGPRKKNAAKNKNKDAESSRTE
jgi:hypothetical protein